MGLNKRVFTSATGGITGTDHFAQQNYSGNRTARTITTGFRPSLVFTKTLEGAEHPMLHSSTMHTANAGFYFTLTNAAYYNSTTFTGFASNGYTLGTDSAAHVNYTSKNYTSFAWKGNGTNSLVSNTDGDVTSYTDANTDGGFTTVKATHTGNQTVGHGLNSAPEFFIQRSNATGNFYAWHHNMGNAYQNLNVSNDGDTAYTHIASTSTTMRFLGSSSNTNNTWYAWHSVEGYSKVSYYTGNSTSKSVNLGFEPRMIWIIPDGNPNIMITSLQEDSNGYGDWIYPNSTSALYTGSHTDNGIKPTSTGFDVGSSTYVNQLNTKFYYLAFA